MSPEEAASRMRELIANGDLPQPDEVIHDADNEELNLLWHDRKLLVIVELTERAPALDA